jgi:uncharacterized membrane protein YqiK
MPASLQPNLIYIGGAIGLALFLLILISTTFRFYKRCGADEALVRTGMRGNNVQIGGGILVFPLVHQLLRVSLRSVKLSVERSGKNALVTADKIKANVTTELYIKVEPLKDDVLAAARSFGERNLDEHAIADLIEGKLTDALRSVAANQTFMSLHANRKQFAEKIQEVLAEELKKNGLTLENVSITAFAMVSVKELDPSDVFDAEGLRAITESVQTNRELTNRIQREKDNQITEQNVAARKRQLELEQAQKMAEADQARKVQEYAAMQAAETARAVYTQEQARDLAALDKERALAVGLAAKQRAEREAQIAAEQGQQAAEIAKQRVILAANIEKEKVVQAAEVERQKAIEAAAIDKEKAIEVARIAKQIAIAQSQEQEARAAAAKALALAEEEKARQTILTAETTAKAERERAVQVIAAQAEAEVQKALAEAAAAQKRIEAEARAIAAAKEAEAAVLLASAAAQRGEAEAQARRKMLEAENQIAARVVLREVLLKALEKAPEITRELMAPAMAIKEIRVLQTSGLGGSNGAPNGHYGLGAVSPILKTVLDAGAAYPLLKELMGFAQSDPVVSQKAKALVQDLGGELSSLLGNGSAAPSTAEVKEPAAPGADVQRAFAAPGE